MTIYKEKDNMGTKVVAKTKPTPNFDLKEPLQYKVIYINDEVTTMDFVIMSLITVFNHSPEMAQSLCDEVHEKGAGTAAMGVWDSGVARGIANQISNSKWSDSYQPSRGKANPLV